MAKFILPDNSPQNKKRMVAVSGAYSSPSQDSPTIKKNGLANSTLVNLPITRNAQFAGSGASVAMTQPMFFSPLHTPQNWQIASRRREIMQWSRFYYMNEPKVAAGVDFYCFTPDNFVLMADGTEKFIKDVKEGDMVVDGDGSFRKILKTHKRHIEEGILRIKVGGFNREIKVTLGHEIPRVSQKDWIKSSLTTPSRYKKKERINKFGEVQLKSIYKDANSIEIGDRLFTPISNIGEGRKDISEDMCYVLGAFVAEGSYYWYENKDKVKIPKGLRFSIHEDEINNFGRKIIDILEKTYNKNVRVYSQNNERCIDLVLFDTELSKMFYKEVGKGSKTKKISEKFINQANKEQLLSFMAGFIDGDGCFDSHHGCQIKTSSDSLFSQVSFILEKLGLSFSVFKDEPKIRKVPNGCLSKTEIYSYNIRVSRRDCEIFKNYSIFYKELKAHNTKYREFLGMGNRIYRAAISIVDDFYKGDVYDLTVEGEHSYVVNRVAVHNSNFSMNGFKLECKSKKILKFYERLVEKIDLSEKCNAISHEYFLIGDVFPFTEIDCPSCFPQNTLVLTECGNRNIQDLKVNDKVLTVEGEFKPIIKTIARKYNGDMVSIKTQSLPLIKSTENHKHYIVRPEYRSDNRVKKAEWLQPIQVEAKDIQIDDYIASPFNTELRKDVKKILFDGAIYRKRNKHLALKKEIKITEEFAELMGWYVAKGSTDSNRTVHYTINLSKEVEALDFIARVMQDIFSINMKIEERWAGNALQISGYSREVSAWFDDKCGYGSLNKKIPDFIMMSSLIMKKAFLRGLLNGDGHIRRNENNITTISKTLCHDIISLLSSIGESCYVTEKEEQIDNLGIHRKHCYRVSWHIDEKKKNGQGIHKEGKFIFFKVKNIVKEKEETVVYNITVDENHNYIANNFHTRNCGGSGRKGDGELCNHADGTFKSIKLMNPDYLDVKDNPLASNPEYYLVPDEELKLLVQRQEPRSIYESLPPGLISAVSSGQPIRLSDRCISHLKHNASDYGTYGTSMLQRLFTVLAYKTKLMTANWIVAERLILPVRVVKVGDKDRPATDGDLQDIQNQLSAVANDPNLTIVTHHAFEYEWFGACHDEETEVLTNRGFKKIGEFEDEEILTYNANTKKTEYQKPQKYHEYDYDGEMISLQGKRLDIMVTPNHRMLASWDKKKWDIKQASELKHGMRLIGSALYSCDTNKTVIQHKNISTNCLQKINDNSYNNFDNIELLEDTKNYKINIDNREFDLKDFLAFVGIYLTEGSLTCTKTNYRIFLYQNKNRYFDKIKDILNNLNLKNSVYTDKRSNNSRFNIYNKELVVYVLEQFGHGAKSKSIPSWIKNLPCEYLEVLLQSMLLGDGCKRKTEINSYVYTTISETLANDFQEIAFKCGYSSRKYNEQPHSSSLGNNLLYRVHISKGEKSNGSYPIVRHKNMQKKYYKGKVYCFTVPNSFFVTRRNGKITVQGNSGKIHNITQEIEQIGKEILDGLMLNQAILNGEMAGYCYSEDTKTLTDSGFKNYGEIDPEKDKIACYNPDTKKIEYHLPYEKMVYDYEGEMVYFNTDKIDILVTPNHRMWSAKRDSNKYRFIKAESIKPRARFIGAVDGYEGEYQKSVQIGDEEYSIYDYLKMVGYYVSEGWVREDKRKNRKHRFTTVGISQSKMGKARDSIEEIFNNMFETHWEQENEVCVYKPSLALYLKEEFGKGAINKKLSSFVKNLTPECLEIVIEAMINGDGCVHNHIGEDRKVKGESYYTSSYQLAEDFAEIAFKCGYVVKIREYNKKDSKDKKYYNKKGYPYKTKYQQYVVYISKGFKGRTPILCSKSKKYAKKEITRVPYQGKIYCFSVPHELFVTMRNGIVSIQGNSSAQVGIEVLIRRLDNWRNKLKDWVETNIFKPIAMMQGFIDEKESQEAGETVYLYPKLTWNDLQLRDKTNRIQTLMQMYDKGMVSSQTILEEMDLDYDSEVEKIREEQVIAQGNGMVAGMGGGGVMAGAPMGGGVIGGDMGGVPGMDVGMGGVPGMDAGMGGAPGMDAGMGGVPGGAPSMGAAASGELPKIGKRGSQNKKEEEKQKQKQKQKPQSKMIQLTSLEQKMFRTLSDMGVKQNLFAQYQVQVPGESRPYSIDFAYPQIGIGIECLHPETYVITTEGIKRAEEIKVGDKLFGREGKEVEVIRYMEKEYNKEMYIIKPYGMLPLNVTDNHPLYICKPEKIRVKRKESKRTTTKSYEVPGKECKVRADKIEVGDYVVVPKRKTKVFVDEILLDRYNIKNTKDYRLPYKIKMDEDFGWLMGIYAAEGCSNNLLNASVKFTLNINEIEYSDKIQYLLKKIFNIESSLRIDTQRDCRSVISYCSSLSNFLHNSFGKYSYNKEVPPFLYNASNECKKAFIIGCVDGYGCQRKNETYRLVSSSRKLLMGLQSLIASLGYWSSIVLSRKPGVIAKICGRTCITRGLWELDFKFKKHKKAAYREDDNNFYIPIKKIEKNYYKGNVINYTVKGEGSSNHTYLVHNLLNSNCDGAIWHEREDFQQRDLNRDQKLANVGWRVLRFNEDALNEHMDSVKDIIIQHITDASKSKKKAETESLIKTASVTEEENPLYEYCLSKGDIGCSRVSIPYGQILYLGNIENE